MSWESEDVEYVVCLSWESEEVEYVVCLSWESEDVEYVVCLSWESEDVEYVVCLSVPKCNLLKTKVLLHQALVPLEDFSHPVYALWFSCSQRLKLFVFPTFWP